MYTKCIYCTLLYNNNVSAICKVKTFSAKTRLFSCKLTYQQSKASFKLHQIQWRIQTAASQMTSLFLPLLKSPPKKPPVFKTNNRHCFAHANEKLVYLRRLAN